MDEFYIKEGKLISEQEWKTEINRIKSKIDSEIKNKEQIKKILKEKLINAISKRADDNFAVLFSGGLDSSFIASVCKKLNKKFTCYTVGFKDGNFKIPEDIEYAEKVSEFLNARLRTRLYNLTEAKGIIEKTAKILGKNANVVNVGVGSVFVACSEISDEKIFFSGLGSEELFAGYERHLKNPTNEECWQGLLNMHQRDLLRDYEIAKKLKIKIMTPFLDPDVIEFAMRIPAEYKISSKGSKLILREISDLGEFSGRKKRAAQYGSSFDRAILKLARINKFKYKKDYLNSIVN